MTTPGPLSTKPTASLPAVPFRYLVVAALSLFVNGVALAAAVASTIGMAAVGEPYVGTDLVSAAVLGGFGAVVMWMGWRAYRRRDQVSRKARLFARLAPVFGGAGLVAGQALGVWLIVLGQRAALSSDTRACALFTGPLSPRDPDACISVARECRHNIRSGPPPVIPRGLQPGLPATPATPVGLELPDTAVPRAIANCMLDRSDRFLR